MERERVYAFDFDGTITRCDTFIDFMRFSLGDTHTALCLLIHLPAVVLTKLRLHSPDRLKARLLKYWLKGWRERDLEAVCRAYGQKRGPHIIRPEARDRIRQILSEGHHVYIVTASIDHWVREVVWQNIAPASPLLTLVDTRLETVDGTDGPTVTGRLATPNCNREEKVRRLTALLQPRTKYHLTAYGDSRGDKAMYDYADEHHHKAFH